MGKPDLDQLRAQIDGVDRELLALVQRRLQLARAIGDRKLAAGQPVHQPEREATVMADRVEHAVQLGLDPEQAARLFAQLMAWARAAQQR